jgi:hypothetical protein
VSKYLRRLTRKRIKIVNGALATTIYLYETAAPLLRRAEREKSDKGGGRRKSIQKFCRPCREKHLKYRENTILWRLLRYATCSTEATSTLPNFSSAGEDVFGWALRVFSSGVEWDSDT